MHERQGDTPTSARPAPDRPHRVLMACGALAFGVAGALLLWTGVMGSVACLADAGDNSPYCDSRWSVLAGAVVYIPLLALCAASALATARGARHGRRLTRRERRLVIAFLVVLTLFGLVQPFGILVVPFAWLVVVVFVLLVRGLAAATRSASRLWFRPAGS